MTTTKNDDLDIPSWFDGKTIAELNAIEFQNRILIPEAFHTFGPKGEARQTKVLVELPSEAARGRARVAAIAQAREMRKGSNMQILTVEDAQRAVGGDVFENLDTCAIVAECCRELEPPHGQMFLLFMLLETFKPLGVILQLFERLDFYARLWNPYLGELEDGRVWAAAAAISKVRNLSPLAVMRGGAQTACIVRMAELLSSSRRSSSLSPSTEISTPAPLPTTT
jgi:hypothetical protein